MGAEVRGVDLACGLDAGQYRHVREALLTREYAQGRMVWGLI